MMNLEQWLRATAGTAVFGSVVLSHLHTPMWLFFTGFVGLNLFQSAFSGWCPAIGLYKKMGIKTCQEQALEKLKDSANL